MNPTKTWGQVFVISLFNCNKTMFFLNVSVVINNVDEIKKKIGHVFETILYIFLTVYKIMPVYCICHNI